MKKIFLLSLLLLSAASLLFAQDSASANKKSKYVGFKYTGTPGDGDLPDALKNFGGALLTDAFKPNIWGVALVGKGTSRMIWLEREYARTPDKQFPKWQVKDVLQFPKLAKNDEILYNGDCTKNRRTVSRTIILATLSRSKKYSVKKAWTANLKSGKFQSISIKGIRCELYEP